MYIYIYIHIYVYIEMYIYHRYTDVYIYMCTYVYFICINLLRYFLAIHCWHARKTVSRQSASKGGVQNHWYCNNPPPVAGCYNTSDFWAYFFNQITSLQPLLPEYIHMYIHIYIYIYTCIYIYIFMYLFFHIYICNISYI